MTYTVDPDTTRHTSDTTRPVITAMLAVAGIVAAALGVWMAYGPDEGTLTLFGWTWKVADLSELWAPFLMIGGGVVAAFSMGTESARDWEVDNKRWLVGLEALVMVAAMAAVLVGVILLF